MTIQRTISPVDGSVVVERELADEAAMARALDRSRAAYSSAKDDSQVRREAMQLNKKTMKNFGQENSY